MRQGSSLASNTPFFGVDPQASGRADELHTNRYEPLGVFLVPLYGTGSGGGFHHAIGDTVFM